MKILVIGNGFIAKPIIAQLQSEGHSLKVYSKSAKVDVHCEQVVGDIFDFKNFIKVLSWEPQIIIQAAWVTSHVSYTEDPLNYEFTKFTLALVKEVLRTNLEHFIVLGSCAEYGLQMAPSIAGETCLNPNNVYAKQKVTTFSSCLEILSKSDIRLTWARIFQPYGFGQDQNRLIPYLISALRANEKIHLRDITTLHDWITTQDIASAISWVVNKSLPVEVDVGTSIGHSNLEVLEKLQKIMGFSDQSRFTSASPVGSRRMAVVGKSSPLFSNGWRPTMDLDAGMEWLLT
jgi:nucleoside-diphosphate-sugar epimerase